MPRNSGGRSTDTTLGWVGVPPGQLTRSRVTSRAASPRGHGRTHVDVTLSPKTSGKRCDFLRFGVSRVASIPLWPQAVNATASANA